MNRLAKRFLNFAANESNRMPTILSARAASDSCQGAPPASRTPVLYEEARLKRSTHCP